MIAFVLGRGGAEKQPPHETRRTSTYCNARHQLLKPVGIEGIPEVERTAGRWFARSFAGWACPAADGDGGAPAQPRSPSVRRAGSGNFALTEYYIFNSRLALPFNSFSLSSAQIGSVSVHIVPGGLSTNG